MCFVLFVLFVFVCVGARICVVWFVRCWCVLLCGVVWPCVCLVCVVCVAVCCLCLFVTCV